MNKADFASLLGKNKGENQVQKQMIIYTTPLEDNIKDTLKSIASKGYGSLKPTLITIEEVKKAINEYKQENQIYSDINMNNVTELSLSFKRILKIENLDNLVKLEKLKLDNNMIMKIQNLDSLVNIKWLDLSFNNISVIEGLDKLVNLADLSLFNNQITAIGGLDNCKKLNVLSIGKNQIKNPRLVFIIFSAKSNLLFTTL